MLTQEIITANEALKGLSEEQIGAIVTLSQNDENEQFRVKFGEHYRQLDASIEEHSGVPRNGAEKTYDYLPRAIDAMKSKYENEITELKSKKGEGTSEELETTRAELKTTKEQFNDLQTKYKALEGESEKKLLNYRISNDFEVAKSGLKYKEGLNEVAVNTLVEQAVKRVKGLNPKYEERNGKEVLIFHDENGSPLNNPENKLNPYTAKELLVKELSNYGILAEKTKTGTGTTTPQKEKVLTASTQEEAMEAITSELLAKGLVKGSSAFQKELDKYWRENKISELPTR